MFPKRNTAKVDYFLDGKKFVKKIAWQEKRGIFRIRIYRIDKGVHLCPI